MDSKIEKRVTVAVTVGIITFIGCFMAFVIRDNENNKMEQAINNGMFFKFKEEGTETIEYGSDVQPKEFVKEYKGELRVPSLDTKKVGVQNLKYVLTYGDMESEYYKTIIVKDTQMPEIKAKKGTEFTIEKGEKMPFSIKDFEAKDSVDGKLKVTMENKVDVHRTGKQFVRITAKDKNNNRVSKTITVKVKEKDSSKKMDYSLGDALDSYEKINETSIHVRNHTVHVDSDVSKATIQQLVQQFNLCPNFLLASVDSFEILNQENFDASVKPGEQVIAHCRYDEKKATVYLSESFDDNTLIHECSHAFDFRYKVTENIRFQEIYNKEKNQFNDQARVNAHEFFAYTFTSYVVDGFESLAKKCPETANYYKEMNL